jgi:hypothetical protein
MRRAHRLLPTLKRLALVAAASCDSGADTSAETTANERCGETTPINGTNRQGPEIVGQSSDASVFPEHRLPIGAGDEVKIVWRMTGRGELTIQVVDPSGREREFTFGPERHGGSNYRRPGDEWGSGFRFDEAGRWHIHLTRAVGAGDVWIDVA